MLARVPSFVCKQMQQKTKDKTPNRIQYIYLKWVCEYMLMLCKCVYSSTFYSMAISIFFKTTSTCIVPIAILLLSEKCRALNIVCSALRNNGIKKKKKKKKMKKIKNEKNRRNNESLKWSFLSLMANQITYCLKEVTFSHHPNSNFKKTLFSHQFFSLHFLFCISY